MLYTIELQHRNIKKKKEKKNSRREVENGMGLSRVVAKPRNVPESSLASTDRCEPPLLSFSSSLPVSSSPSPWRRDVAGWPCARVRCTSGLASPGGTVLSRPKTGSVCFRALYRGLRLVYTPVARDSICPREESNRGPGRRIGRTISRRIAAQRARR